MWRTLIAALVLLAALSCASGRPGNGTPTPEPTATPPPTLTPTATPMATASPTESPSEAPQASIQEREGLWAGPVQNPNVPWLAFRVIPGENPDADRWLFESGPLGLPTISCQPERRENGWQLGDCTGLPPGSRFAAFVPVEGESGLDIDITVFEPDGLLRVQASLTRIQQRDEPISSANVSLAWHHRRPIGFGPNSDIWAADGLVFAPHLGGEVEILDASSGEPLGTADVDVAPPATGRGRPIALDVKARDGLLYAATADRGLVIFDVSDPAKPRLIGQHLVFIEDESPENFTNIHNIFLSPAGDIVYAINQSHPSTDLRLIDVSDPSSPKEAGRFAITTGGEPIEGVHDINVIEIDGRLVAFLNYLGSGLHILDVTDPAAIEVLGSIRWEGTLSHSGWPFRLGDRLYYAHNDEGYDQGLTVLDVTNLREPQVISRFSTRSGISIHNVEVIDGIAYISYYIDGLRVLDLRDPTRPREIGHFDTVPAEEERDIVQGAWGVRVLNGVVYISDIETGIYAFNVDVP